MLRLLRIEGARKGPLPIDFVVARSGGEGLCGLFVGSRFVTLGFARCDCGWDLDWVFVVDPLAAFCGVGADSSSSEGNS